MTEVSKQIIERIKTHLEEIIIINPLLNTTGIANALGIGRTTLWAARKQDADLDKLFNDLIEKRDMNRAEMVEDKFISRLVNGESAEAGYIFYLCNKFPEKYKDRRAVIGSLHVGAHATAVAERQKEIPDDELIRAGKAIFSRDNL